MRKCAIPLPGILILSCAAVLNATTVHVPADQPTIQAGIDAAVDGDTVLVADGIYRGDGNRDIRFWGKAIALVSENGPVATVIHCEASAVDRHRGFSFDSGEGPASVLEGFTVRSGWVSDNGGGIYCHSSSPTIEGNIIDSNSANFGGGIHCNASSPLIRENAITGNTANYTGGAIYLDYGSHPAIEDNTIVGNKVDYSGAGIICRSSSPVIAGNTIVGNTADHSGGGIYCYRASPTIDGNTIAGNSSAYGGGIMCVEYCYPVIEGNVIEENTASSLAGGVFLEQHSYVTLLANIIARNTSEFSGGGIYSHSCSTFVMLGNAVTGNTAGTNGGGVCCWFSFPSIENCTIAGNRADGSGGGIFCDHYAVPVMTNSVVYGNPPGEMGFNEYGDIIVTYSDIGGGWPGEGNIDDDPLFVDPGNEDYRLTSESPCVDAGDPSTPNVRWGGWRRDMGAFEYDQGFYYDGRNLIRKPFPFPLPSAE